MLPEQPTDPVANNLTDPVASNPIDPIISNSSDLVTSNPTDPVASNPIDPIISNPTDPVASSPSDPVTNNSSDPIINNPPRPVTSEKIVRISEFRLLLLLVAFVIIVTSVLGGIGVGMDYQNHMRASATATAGEATFQVMNNATSTAAVATSQAIVGATTTALAGVTATAQANPYPSYLAGNGTLAFVDPLNQPDDNWSNNSNSSQDGAQFTQGAYHISQSQNDHFYFSYASGDFSNFAFEVQMTITKGDCGGIMFRYNFTAGGLYFFSVCQNGFYWLDLHRDRSNNNIQALTSGSSAAIHTGYNQSNVIAVVANGSSIGIYVNGQQIGNVNDATYSAGAIALCAEDVSSPTEVVYNNARVWTF